MWMNEHEVATTLRYFEGRQREYPNYYRAAVVLDRLVDWTNRNGDGWPYWQKPGKAARRLMDLLNGTYIRGASEDIEDATLKWALTPIKAFLTREGVEHDAIFGEQPRTYTRLDILRTRLRAEFGDSVAHSESDRIARLIDEDMNLFERNGVTLT